MAKKPKNEQNFGAFSPDTAAMGIGDAEMIIKMNESGSDLHDRTLHDLLDRLQEVRDDQIKRNDVIDLLRIWQKGA